MGDCSTWLTSHANARLPGGGEIPTHQKSKEEYAQGEDTGVDEASKSEGVRFNVTFVAGVKGLILERQAGLA